MFHPGVGGGGTGGRGTGTWRQPQGIGGGAGAVIDRSGRVSWLGLANASLTTRPTRASKTMHQKIRRAMAALRMGRCDALHDRGDGARLR